MSYFTFTTMSSSTEKKELQIISNYMLDGGYWIIKQSARLARIYRTAPICGESFYDSMGDVSHLCKKLTISNYNPNGFDRIVNIAKELCDSYYQDLIQ